MAGPLNIDRALLAVASRLDFEGQGFADLRPAAVTLKRRDVHEDRVAAMRWRDEPEAAVIVPLLEFSVEAHR